PRRHATASPGIIGGEQLRENALRRFEHGEPTGRVGLVAFECIAIGIAKNITNVRGKPDPVGYVRQRVLDLWASPDLAQFFAAGLRGTIRIQRTVTFGATWFAT
ncbi:MAG: DUF262 domain-containing protein, partial [Alphaproteobacteria bacterium]